MNGKQIGNVLTIMLVLHLWSSGAALGALPPSFHEDFTSTAGLDLTASQAVIDTTVGEVSAPPFHPTITHTFGTQEVYDIELVGNIALLAKGSWGLEIINNVAMTQIVTDFREPGDIIQGIAAGGTRAYLAAGYAGLKVVDITDPAVPTKIGQYDSPGNATDVVVAGDRAYLADGTAGVAILDISTSTPTLLGVYDTPGVAKKLALHGSLLYVADGTEGLQILDVSNPLAILPVGSHATTSMTNDVAVVGRHAFVADNYGGVVALDVTDPSAPVVTSTLAAPAPALSIQIVGDRAMVAIDVAGLQIVDIAHPDALREVGSFNIGVRIRSAASRTTVGYIGGAMGVSSLELYGQQIALDITEHTALGGIHGVDHMAVDGNLLFASLGDLAILDISDPSQISQLWQGATAGVINDIAVSGSRAYVADGTSGLTIVDAGDPSSASILSTLSLSGSDATAVVVSGGYAFVAASDTLYTIDVSYPLLPNVVQSLPMVGTQALALDGNLLYAARGSSGLSIYDVSAPATGVSLVGSYNVTGYGYDVAVYGDQAFLALGVNGLTQIDVSDPTNPQFSQNFTNLSDPREVSVESQYLAIKSLSGIELRELGNGVASLVGEVDSFAFPALDILIHGQDILVGSSFGGLDVVTFCQDEIEDSWVQGLPLTATDDPIVRVKPAPAGTGYFLTAIKDDDGVNNSGATSGWVRLATPSVAPIWTVSLFWGKLVHNPVLTSLDLDIRTTRPYVDTITDIPGDQGRQVRVTWQRSGFDFPGEAEPITQYAIYREYAAKTATASDLPASLAAEVRADALDKSSQGWEFVTSVPVRNDDHYAVVTSTLVDSTIAAGQAWSTFMVTALTATPGVFYDSPPDSGYSVDNLAPSVPAGFKTTCAAAGNDLSWLESQDADFQYFNIYRGITTDFVPSAENRVQTLIGTAWTDDGAGSGFFYKLTAVDFAGNESDAAVTETVSGVDQPGLPTSFALLGNAPNPFNPSTTIAFTVPEGAGKVSVAVYDVRGQIVARLIDGVLSPGVEKVIWNGRNLDGGSASSGMYFVSLVSGTTRLTQKISLVK